MITHGHLFAPVRSLALVSVLALGATACSSTTPSSDASAPTPAASAAASTPAPDANPAAKAPTPAVVAPTEGDGSGIDVAKAIDVAIKPQSQRPPAFAHGKEGDPIRIGEVTVDGSTVKLTGVADIFENNLLLVLHNNDTQEERYQYVTIPTAQAKPYPFAIEITNLAKGTWNIRCVEDNPGAEESATGVFELSFEVAVGK